MEFKEAGAEAGLGGFFGGGEFALGQRDAALLGNDPHRFGKADVFDLAHEGEDVAGGLAAEAVIELAGGVDVEGGCLFVVERAEAAVVLGAGLAQSDVALDYLDDVGLLLDGFGEVGHGRDFFSGYVRRDAGAVEGVESRAGG